MDIERFLEMKYEELFPALSGQLLSDPGSGRLLIEKLSASELYKSDFSFRASIDSAEGMLHLLEGDYEGAIRKIAELIERVSALGLWKLKAANWNNLGNAFNALQIRERALECYSHVINEERRHGENDISSVAYYNISVLYASSNALEKALEFVEMAIDTLKTSERRKNDISRQFLYMTFYMQLLSRTDRIEKAREVYGLLMDMEPDKRVQELRFSFYAAGLYYKFATEDHGNCRDWYRDILALVDERDFTRKYIVINAYAEVCEKYGLSYDYYGEQLLEAENLPEAPSAYINAEVYRRLRNYYIYKGDKENLERVTEKYIGYMDRALSDFQEKQRHSLDTLNSVILCENSEEVNSKNIELKMIAEETLRMKRELERTYSRYELVSAIGRNIVSSTNFDEVVDMIFETLREHVPLESFVLMMYDAPKNELRSAAVYYKHRVCDEIIVHPEDGESMIAKCFRTGEVVVSDARRDKNLKRLWKNECLMNSAVFAPLNVGEKCIGVYSVQSGVHDSYGEEELSFLKILQPYLAIALNNAIHLWKLEYEIESRRNAQTRLENEIMGHMKTQEDLQNAYDKLELISSLDGLTQISSRRDFENRFLAMLRTASEYSSAVSVFMMDIDNFKVYNDTYGHLEGDEALKLAAKEFRRELDVVGGLSARFGGEEFIGACIGIEAEECRRIAQRICDGIRELGIENKNSLGGILTVSIGVSAAVGIGPESRSDIMRLADISLYEAKDSGKNRVVLNHM